MDYAPPNDIKNSKFKGRTFVVSVNEKGRMTLPANVRQSLRLPPEPSLVELSVQEDGSIVIQGRLPTVAETAGVVPKLEPAKDWKEIEATVRDDVAECYWLKMNR